MPVSRTRTRVLDLALLGSCLALALVLLADLVDFRYARDHGLYAAIARQMVLGKAPYRDAWDIKPPGISILFALVRLALGSGMRAIRLVEAAALASVLYAFSILSRRWVDAPRAGIVGGAIAILAHVGLEFWHTGQPELFGGVLVVWAIVCATVEPEAAGRRVRWAWLGCGALYGAAFVLKPTVACGLPITMAWTAARGRATDPARPSIFVALRRPALWMSLGASVPILAVSAWIVSVGAWPDFWYTMVRFAPRYAGIDFDPAWVLELCLRAAEQWTFWFSTFFPIGFAALLAMRPLGPREREGTLHAGAVAATQLVGVAVQGKFIPYHYSAALPLGALLAGWGFWKIWRLARTTLPRAVAFGVLLVVLAALVTPEQMEEGDDYHLWPRFMLRLRAMTDASSRTAIEDRLSSHYDVSAKADRDVAEWLASHTPAGSSVFVWGFEPIIYEMAGRDPASRYLQDQPQRVSWDRETSRRALMADLDRSRPAAIVVQHGDVIPIVTGNRLDSAAALADFPEMLALLRRDYEGAAIIEDFEIYARKPGH